ncbi:MAG: FAD-dependent oxidoreductase [Clostridia bacterium]|nr:FAD-dependent oxidoreductase [Clostridia bacterium]
MIAYSRNIPLKYEADVFVAGGGPAGVAAALAASRLGKRVFLAEAQGMFGGAGTAGLVPSFAVFGDGVRILAEGIGREVREAACPDVPIDTKWTPIRVEDLKRTYDRLLAESTVNYSLFTSVCDVVSTDGHVDYVVLTAKSGLFAVKASVYVDCTGDGDLCALGGGRFEAGDESGDVMPATLCSLWAGIDYGRVTLGDGARLEDAFRDGVFTYEDRHLSGIFHTDQALGIGGGNVGHTFGVDPLDERSLTRSIMWGRKSMLEYRRYYREYIPGYERAEPVMTAGMLGVRESRRIVCDYMLNIDDFVAQSVFEDEIGRYCYPVDIHVMTTDKSEYSRFQKEYGSQYRYGKGESYGIPYRALIPASFDNMLTAGRCMGADRRMQASIRVMPGCFITGQAAGAAAALAADSGDVRRVDTASLQEKLASLGAYLPNRSK